MNQEDKQEQETREVQPMQSKDHADLLAEEPLPLSQFIAALNTRFGTNFNEDDAVMRIGAIEERLRERTDLTECLQMKSPDDALPIFGQAVMEILKSMVETDHKFYNHVASNRDFVKYFAQCFFEQDFWQKK